MSRVFIHPTEARQLLGDSDTLFIDCRHDLENPDWGRKMYLQSHIPGAIFAHLDEDLSGHIDETTGRHPLPDLDTFTGWVANNGISQQLAIIIYDNFAGGISARLWWMLTQLGFDEVFILIGGFELWKKLSYEIDAELPEREKIQLDLDVSSWEAGVYEIQDINSIEKYLGKEQMIDSRAPERFRGEEEPYDPIPGRIPSAKNFYWKNSIDENLNLIPNEEIKAQLQKNLDLTRLSESTFYCGSGVTACFNLAIIENLGLERPKLYPGSYSEWSRNNPDKIETGE